MFKNKRTTYEKLGFTSKPYRKCSQLNGTERSERCFKQEKFLAWLIYAEFLKPEELFRQGKILFRKLQLHTVLNKHRPLPEVVVLS